MSDASPGPVSNEENLVRIIVSPRDYDPVTKFIAQKPFEKLYANGLSVMRENGSDQDFVDIVEDNLVTKPENPLKHVQEICSAAAGDVRALNADAEQAFCVYDQIVPRVMPNTIPVPTHAGIFQRIIKYDVPGAKKANRDLAFEVYELFMRKRTPVVDFRGHLFKELNEKALSGAYLLNKDPL